MPKLPLVSGKETVKVFLQVGYTVDHQTGSHVILRKEEPPHQRLTIPLHPELAKGTLRAILRQAEMTIEEFNTLLR
jgi:predicted RNA binding protein YcfA (HicA-like mRNA interferase family)